MIKPFIGTREIFAQANNEPIITSLLDQDFYKSKDIYQNNLGLFDGQIDLGVYSMQIYVTASLAEYVGSDPIEKRIQKLDLLSGQKAAIMLELKILRGE